MSDAVVTNWKKARAIALFRAFSLLGSEITVLALVLREKDRASEGMRFILNHVYLRALATMLCCFLFAVGMLQVAQVFLITQILHGSAFIYGLSGAIFSLGLIAGMVGALVISGPLLELIGARRELAQGGILGCLVLLFFGPRLLRKTSG
jgi:hypothetical protein